MTNVLKIFLGLYISTIAISVCHAEVEHWVMRFYEDNFIYPIVDRNIPDPKACGLSLGKIWLKRGYHLSHLDNIYGRDGGLTGGWCVYLNKRSQDPRNVPYSIEKRKIH